LNFCMLPVLSVLLRSYPPLNCLSTGNGSGIIHITLGNGWSKRSSPLPKERFGHQGKDGFVVIFFLLFLVFGLLLYLSLHFSCSLLDHMLPKYPTFTTGARETPVDPLHSGHATRKDYPSSDGKWIPHFDSLNVLISLSLSLFHP
jgi:hypothetical protein